MLLCFLLGWGEGVLLYKVSLICQFRSYRYYYVTFTIFIITVVGQFSPVSLPTTRMNIQLITCDFIFSGFFKIAETLKIIHLQFGHLPFRCLFRHHTFALCRWAYRKNRCIHGNPSRIISVALLL